MIGDRDHWPVVLLLTGSELRDIADYFQQSDSIEYWNTPLDALTTQVANWQRYDQNDVECSVHGLSPFFLGAGDWTGPDCSHDLKVCSVKQPLTGWTPAYLCGAVRRFWQDEGVQFVERMDIGTSKQGGQ